MNVEPRLPEGVERYDQHGFAVFCDDTFCDSERHHPNDKNDTFVNSPIHIEAWQAVLSDWSWTQINGSRRLKSLIRKGVPPSLRQELWLNLLACRNLKETSKFSYQRSVRLIRQELVDLGISEYCLKEGLLEMSGASEMQQDHAVPPQVIRQITVDVGIFPNDLKLVYIRPLLKKPCLDKEDLKNFRSVANVKFLDRTFPTHRLFIDGSLEAKEGRASLFRLLAVYAFYNPEVGYCQGMSYIAGMLLMQMSNEEEAFWALVALFEKPKYLSGYFDQSLIRIQQHAAVFQKLITHRLPKFARHLASMELHLLTFVTPWFMCLYTSFPCWDTVLTIWDLILLDGISTIFRVALAVLRVSQEELLQTSDMSCILPKLLHPPPALVSAENLLPVIWKTTVDKWEIDALQAIVAEESDPKPGRKRRRQYKSDSEGSEQAGKRLRGEDRGDETTMFQRVLGLFRSSTSRKTQRGPSKMSHASRTRASNRANQARRKMPGMAKASTMPWSMAPSTSTPFSIQANSEISFVPGKAPDWKTCTEFSFAPNVFKDKSTPPTKEVQLMKSKTPDQKIITELSLAPSALEGKAALQSKKVTSAKVKVPGSVRWTRFQESTSCSSPWREGLRALTLTLPVHDGIMLSTEDTPVTESYSRKENSLNKPASGLVGGVKTMIGAHHSFTKGSSDWETKPELQMGDEERISPCVVAAEESLNPLTTQEALLAKSSQRRSSSKAVRFSPRFSEKLGNLTSRENIRSLNTPSGRRFLSKSAKVMHSFKTFHTPTPLRKSQGCGHYSSPEYASPDLEVELQPMKLAARLRKGY